MDGYEPALESMVYDSDEDGTGKDGSAVYMGITHVRS